MKFSIAFILLSSLSILGAEELTFLTLKSYSQEEIAKSYHGKELQIRGFLYTTASGKTILAATPNVKSCCVGTASKLLQQITVINPKQSASSLPVTLSGHFFVEPQYNEEGTLIELYRLY